MSTTPSGTDSGSDAAKERRELLLKVYGAALDEYRFNVQLTWDRTKFYLGLAATTIAAGVGLMRLASDSAITSAFLSLYFGLLIVLTALGWQTARTGKSYYRQAILTKTLVERELGLHTQLPGFNNPDFHLGIAVTPGQRDIARTLSEHERKLSAPARTGSVVSLVGFAFMALIALEILGVILSFALALSAYDKEPLRPEMKSAITVAE